MSQAIKSCSRILSSMGRLTADMKCARAVSQSAGLNSSWKSKRPKSQPKPSKEAARAKKRSALSSWTLTESGDTYKVGESYYFFKKYSFYDLDCEINSHRLPQPNSGKKEC